MKFTLFPKTKLGSVSVTLFVLLVVLVAFFFLAVNVFDQRGGNTFFSNLWLTVPMLLAWGCGVGAFVTGTLAVIKEKSGSLLVYLVLLLTALTTLFGIAEVAFPH